MLTNLHAFDTLVLFSAVLLLSGVLVSKVSTRFGIPALLLFAGVGMLAGSEGIGGIHFDNFALTNSLGVIALIFILFAGGLDTHWKSIKGSLGAGVSLATVGVALTAGTIFLVSHFFLGISWELSVILGAVVSSTDAAAVFSILKAQGLKLKGNLVPLLELESGSNDPMAVILTVGITTLILDPTSKWYGMVPAAALQIVLGGICGFLIGRGGRFLVNRLKLAFDGLYPVLTIGIALLAYSLPQMIGGNGYLAVYVAGMTLGTGTFVHRVSLIQFHDALGWLMQIAMFLCLGLLVYPSHLVPHAGMGIVLALSLIFIARPFAVLVSLLPFKIPIREKLFISWVGLRGAVPIILATIPVTSGIVGSTAVFNLVFFIVLVSVLVQGMTISTVASLLGVQTTEEFDVRQRKIATTMLEVVIPPSSPVAGMRVVDLNLPEGVLIALLTRAGESFVPHGGTVVQGEDTLLISDRGVKVEALREFFLKGSPMRELDRA